MNQTADVVVVGGGVIGCFIAYELSKAGLAVVVVEKGQVGAEASSAAAGLLVPLHMTAEKRDLFDLHLASTQMFPSFVPALQQETGIDVEHITSGILRISTSEAEETEVFARFQTWQKMFGMAMTWLDKTEIHSLEPELAPTVCGGIFSHDEAYINNGRLVLALARAASLRKARVLEGWSCHRHWQIRTAFLRPPNQRRRDCSGTSGDSNGGMEPDLLRSVGHYHSRCPVAWTDVGCYNH